MALPGRIRGSGARGRGLRRPMAAAAAAAIPPPSSSSPSPSSGASPLPLPRAARGSGGSPTSVAFPGFGSGQGSASASSLDGLSKGDKECFQNLLEMEEESIGTEDGVEDQELDRLLSELEGGGEDGFRRGGGGGGGSRPQAPSSAAGGAGRTTMALWLMFWLFNNVALTVLNKATFSKFDFRYPFFLSFFHMMCNWAGGEAYFRLLRRYTSRNRGAAPRAGFAAVLLEPAEVARLDRSGTVRTWLFSVVFSMNIAIGNVSLRYVSVNFNQVMRSLVPAVAILIGCCMGKSTSGARLCAVVPVVGGVAMACFGEMQVTAIGFVFTCLCVVLAALKAVAAGEILSGSLKLHPIDLLYKMAPKAALQCLLLSCLTGEIASITQRWPTELSPAASLWPTFGVVSTGLMSFSLNISSLVSNKLTSPLTLCIAANVKQVLLILLATAVFGTPVTPLNGAGIAVVLCGSALYSYVSMKEKAVGREAPAAKPSAAPISADDSEDEERVGLVGRRR